MHVCEVFVARDEDVGIGYMSQFQQIVILRVATALWNVTEGIVLAAGAEESEQTVAGLWGKVLGELRARGHGHDFLPEDVGHDDAHRTVGQDFSPIRNEIQRFVSMMILTGLSCIVEFLPYKFALAVNVLL